jgi:hypothetical protein
MTPQEKAEQLYNKFLSALPHPETTNAAVYSIAKQCALIAVDEIIESRKDDVAFNDTMWENASEYYKPHPMYLNYWFKLRQEIESI